jgi:hypothetical protein
MKRAFLSILGLTVCASACLAQNVSVAGSTGANATYATLKAAFDALNANTNQTGNTITVTILGNTTETASAVLNQPSGGSWSTLTTSPSGTRSISGAIAGNLIDFNGADNVTISGGGTLMIDNTSNTATATTIRFINDAKNNTVQNCNIKGSGTGTAVGTIFFSTGTSTGNDGNIIDSNNTGGAAITGLALGGSNQSITASSNVIDPITSSGSAAVTGISTASSGTATISKNKIYDLSGSNAGSTISCLLVSAGSVTASNNLIGNLTAPAATGSNAINGIKITSGTDPSTIKVITTPCM